MFTRRSGRRRTREATRNCFARFPAFGAINAHTLAQFQRLKYSWTNKFVDFAVFHDTESEDVRPLTKGAVMELTARFPLYAKRLKRNQPEGQAVGAD